MPNQPHDSWASVYDQVYTQSFGSLYTLLTKVSLEVIQEKTKLGSDILDIGAGTGRLSVPLAQSGYCLCAVDASAKMLDVLEKKDVSRQIKTVHCPVQKLDLNLKFDTVLCVFSVFCYLTELQELRAAIQSIARHTSDTGYVLIDIPSSSSFSSLSYESENLSRHVDVTDLDLETGLFEYMENVRFIDNEEKYFYKDNFKIRCWDTEVILNEFETVGMNVWEDVSERFWGSGANYYILTKT